MLGHGVIPAAFTNNKAPASTLCGMVSESVFRRRLHSECLVVLQRRTPQAQIIFLRLPVRHSFLYFLDKDLLHFARSIDVQDI
jgi:hypothetical protein